MRQKIVLMAIIGWAFTSFFGLVLFAQNQTSDWTEPVNLSQSGSTAVPLMFVDTSHTFHVFWQDTYADLYMYSQGQHTNWTAPISATLPFTASTPTLLADTNGRVHAFWRDAEDDYLLYSHAPITGITDLLNWQDAELLADTAVAVDVVVGTNNQLHLLYLWPDSTPDLPAGVYYRQTVETENGRVWSEPLPLYQSPYLRGLTASDANVDLIIDGNTLFAAWDNRPRKQLLFSRSLDGGQSWQAASERVGPESGSSVVMPFDAKMELNDDKLLFLWSKGLPGNNCQQFWISSEDRGQNWTNPQLMTELLPGLGKCISQSQLFRAEEATFLLSTIEGQVYLWAWNGQRWSDPQMQVSLAGFDHPETLNNVLFRCRQMVVTVDDQLAGVGCDQTVGGFNDGDIWFLSRPLGAYNEWFPPIIEWNGAKVLQRNSFPYYAQAVVSTPDDRLFAFFVSTDHTGAATRQIYLSHYTDGRWSLPEHIITTPEPVAGQLTAVVGPGDNLYLSWAGNNGNVYFMRNAIAEAHIAATWIDPTPLPDLPHFASHPTFAIDQDNILYLIYTVAINEGRGVYLLRSSDNGRSWDEEPLPVFNGLDAEWEMVGPAHLAVTGQGQLHLLLSQQTLNGHQPQTEALHYLRSTDGGQTFTPEDLVVEGSFAWSALDSTDAQTIHQLWQAWNGPNLELLHRYSADGGQTWSRALKLDNVSGAVSLTGDDAGHLFLLNLTDTAVNELQWKNDGWVPQPGYSLRPLDIVSTAGQNIAAAANADGTLVSLFTAFATDPETDEDAYHLFASSRALSETVSVDVVDTLPISTAQATSPATAVQPTPGTVSTALPETTATAVVPTATVPVLNTTQGATRANPISTMLVGLIPLLVLVLLIFVVGVYMMQMRRR